MGAGDLQEISVPSFQICCEPKSTLKNSSSSSFFFFSWGSYSVCFGFFNLIFFPGNSFLVFFTKVCL